MGSNHPVLDGAGLAFLVATTVQFTKVLFYKVVSKTSPNQKWYLRLYTLAIAMVYSYAGAWLLGALKTGPDVVSTYALAFGVAIAAIFQYHLLNSDVDPGEPVPATTLDAAPAPRTGGAIPVPRTPQVAAGSGRAGRPITSVVTKGATDAGGRASASGPGATPQGQETEMRPLTPGEQEWLRQAQSHAQPPASVYVEGPQPDPDPDPDSDPEITWDEGKHVSELSPKEPS